MTQRWDGREIPTNAHEEQEEEEERQEQEQQWRIRGASNRRKVYQIETINKRTRRG